MTVLATALWQDLRHAFRQLRRSPGFAAAVVIMLAVGIGANTAIFSVINAVFLRPLPYPLADELRALTPVLDPADGPPDTLGYWSYPMYEAFRDGENGFERVAAYTPHARAYNLTGGEVPERVRVEMASADYFPLLGVSAEQGRTFLPEEDAVSGAAPVALLSHGLWERMYGGDPSVLGRDISINSVPFTVVGILPPGFRGLSGQAEVWVPITTAPALTFPRRLEGATSFWHFVIGRTSGTPSGDATAAALDARMAAVAASVEERIPLAEAFGEVDLAFAAVPLRDVLIDPAASAPLPVLMGAMAFLLLIVCVNAANLLLTRTTRRRRELGVRLAIGASCARVVRHLIAESMVLAVLGGVAGALVAVWGVELLQTLVPEGSGGPAAILAAAIDGRVLAFNFGVAALTGIAVGALPAVHLFRGDLAASLRDGASSVADGARLRSGLVCAELALALVLLAGAGLMLRSLAGLHAAPLGFEPQGLLTANVELPRQTYAEEEVVRFLDEAVRRLETAPGVAQAGAAYCLPLAGRCDNVGMDIRGEPRPPAAPRHAVWMNMVDGGHFRTFGIPLLAGRTFTDADRAGAPRVAIINEAAARAYWPNRSPIGERMQLSVGWDDWAEVVGVVGDVKLGSIAAPVTPGVYLAYPQWFYRSNYLVVRAEEEADPLALTATLRRVVRGLDPGLPLWDVQTMEERIGGVTAAARFSAVLLSLAAGLALLLAAAGVFGVLAFAVASRTREFGLRVALGAREGDVLRLVLRRGLLLAAIGLAAGLAASVALTRVLSSQLYGVTPTDPAILASVTALLLGVALAAAYFPARRAAKADPMIALRAE